MSQEVGKTPALHVTVYRSRVGEDGVEADVLAHGQLEPPKPGEEGKFVKAVLATVENHQCAGDDCKQLHRYAEDRVIGRIGADSKLAVAWRRFHPLVVSGTVEPGKELEHEAHGSKIRVQVREIVEADAAEITAQTVSVLGLQRLETDLQQQEARTALRGQVRDLMKRVDADKPVRAEAIEKLMQELAPVADGPELGVANGAATAATAAVFDELDRSGAALLRKANLADADIAAFNKQIAGAGFDAALTPLTQLSQALRALVTAKKQVDAMQRSAANLTPAMLDRRVNDVVDVQNELGKAPAGFDAAIDLGRAAVKKIAEDATAKAEALLKVAAETLAKRPDTFAKDIESQAVELAKVAADAEEAVQQALAPAELLMDPSDGVVSGWATVTPVRDESGRISRWDVKFENTGERPWVGSCAFVATGKNAGVGFESMGLPGEGYAAVQAIHANEDYGVVPRVGERLRIAVRGHSFIEIGLPENTVRLPLRRLGRMPNASRAYLENQYVTGRFNEKRKWPYHRSAHHDGQNKITFYLNGSKV